MTTTTDRRLDELEAGLPAKQGALLWLDELQRLPSPEAYLRSLFEQPPERTPLVRIIRGARAHARSSLTDATPAAIEAAEREAIRDATFYVHLIGGLQAAADALIYREFFVASALFERMRRISLEWMTTFTSLEPDSSVAPHNEAWDVWRDQVPDLELAVYVEGEARHRIERRYLDGRDVLFAEQVERLAVIGEVTDFLVAQCRDISYQFGLDRIEGFEPLRPALDREALRRDAEPRVQATEARIVDAARSAALSEIGEHADSLAYLKRYALRNDLPLRGAG